jgi:hypothetical protein
MTEKTVQTETVDGRPGYVIVLEEDLMELLNYANNVTGDISLAIKNISTFLVKLGMLDEIGEIHRPSMGALGKLIADATMGGKKKQDKIFESLKELEHLLDKYRDFANK